MSLRAYKKKNFTAESAEHAETSRVGSFCAPFNTLRSLRSLRFILLGVLGFCLFLAVACDKGQPAAPQPPRLTDLLIADGNNQSVLPGQAAPRPLAVRAVDQEGRPMAGVKVTFRVASGGGALSDSTVTTGADGLAQTRLTLGPAAGVNTVVIAVEGLSGLPPTFTVTGLGATASTDTTGGKPPAPTGGAATAVTALSVVPPSLGVRGSGRQETAVITFEARDAANLLVADGEEVAFALVPAGSGTLSAARATTVGGRVSVTLRSDTLAAPVRVTATARGITGAASVPIIGGPPDRAHFSLAAERLNVPGGVIAGLTDRVTAFAFDRFSNPVPAGTSVLFSTTAGGIEGSALTDAQGRASVNLITAEPLPKDGFAVVSARVVGRGDSLITASTRVLFSGPTQLSLQPAALTADTLQGFTYSVRDPIGNPLSGGTRVQVTAQNGQVQGDVNVTLPDVQTGGAGRTDFAFVLRRSPSAQTEVTVAVTSANGNAQRTIVGGAAPGGGGGGPSAPVPARLAITSADTSIPADGLTTTKVTAELTTADGTPIRGASVDFVSSAGLVDPSGVTNAAGQATATLTSAASRTDLRALVRAAFADSLRASVSVWMVGLALTLSSSPDTIAADGNAQSRIVATLKRTGDIPVPFARVNFETTLGALSTSSALTDQKGEATVILTSQPQAGRAVVTASYGAGLTVRREVVFVKGPPASIVLVSVEPPAIGVRGAGSNATALITFEVRDAQGTPVKDGERIAFSLDPAAGGESVNPAESATVNGRVRIAFNSGTVARTVRVIARWTGGSVSSTPVPVAIHGGLPDLTHFSLAPKPVNLAGRVVLGLESTVTAYVFDKYSNPVPAGTSVRFRTDGGGIQGAAETNADGQAAVKLFTAAPIPAGPGFLATITGQTVNENGQSIETSTTVLFSGPTRVRITSADSTTILAGGLSISDGGSRIVTFSVSDIDGKPIMGGSTIKVTSDVARVSGDADVVMPDVRSGSTDFAIAVGDPSPREDPPLSPQPGFVLVRIQSLNGNVLLTFGVTVD